MLSYSFVRQPREYELPLLGVRLPGEVGEVLTVLPQPDLGSLEADNALVTPSHRHDFICRKN